MNARTLFTLMLSALLLGAVSQARAQPYLFAGAGFTEGAGGEQSDLFAVPGIGYHFSQHVAIEAAYFDARTRAASTVAIAPAQHLMTDRRFGLSAASLSLVGRVPISGRLSLTGEASVYRLRGNVREHEIRYDFAGTITATDLGGRSASGKGTTYGLGAGLAFSTSRAVDLRLRLQWMRGADDAFGPGRDLERTRIASVGLAYRF